MINKKDYNEVGGRADTDRMWYGKDNPLEIGDSIEGEFVSKIENAGKKGNSTIYVIKTPNGENVGVWGCAVLDSRFKGMQVGSKVGIEYLGLGKTKKGDDFKNFWVGVSSSIPTIAVDDSQEKEVSPDDLPF